MNSQVLPPRVPKVLYGEERGAGQEIRGHDGVVPPPQTRLHQSQGHPRPFHRSHSLYFLTNSHTKAGGLLGTVRGMLGVRVPGGNELEPRSKGNGGQLHEYDQRAAAQPPRLPLRRPCGSIPSSCRHGGNRRPNPLRRRCLLFTTLSLRASAVKGVS